MHLSHLVETIDTHTAGNPTRNLIAGVPRIEGKTMQDKMAYAEEHLDWLRTAVMMEPRGHSNMSGTIWVEPCHPEADMGILFIDAGGHMPMCGHSTIGCVTAMLESGRVPITGEVTEVNIDTPAGLVRTRATVENGSVTSAYRQALDAFLQNPDGEYRCPDRVLEELARTSHRRYSPGFYFGPEKARQDSAGGGYIRQWEFVGVVEEWREGVARCTQRGKFALGETLEALLPTGETVSFAPAWITNGAGERVEATPHPMMAYTIPCETPLPPHSLLRRRLEAAQE